MFLWNSRKWKWVNFKCLQCDSEEFIVDQYGKCNNCTLDNCKVCKFNEDRTRPICEECSEGLKININGECDYCQDYPHYEQNKNCLKCDKIYEVINCTCLPGFVENQNKPNSKYLECPSECPNDCIYNTEINSLTCTRCQEGYSFNSEGQCTYCGSSCASCEFNEDNNPTCLKCLNEYYLNENTFNVLIKYLVNLEKIIMLYV